MTKPHPLCAAQMPRENEFSFSCLLWPCLEEANRTVNGIMCISISRKGVRRESTEGSPKLTLKTAEENTPCGVVWTFCTDADRRELT